MKSTSVLLACLFAALGLSACGTPPTGAQYIDPNGQRVIVNANRINYQDFNIAASDLIQSMLRKDAIKEKHPGQPTLVAVSRITNDTSQQFNTDQLMNNIRIALLDTGKIQISNLGLAGSTTDPLAQEVAAKNAFIQNKSMPNNAPDYTLYGRIYEDSANAGNVHQGGYFFDLALTDVSTGTTVWEGKASIVKQGKDSSIGF